MDTKQTKKILLGITYTVVLAFLLYRISDVVDISKNLFNVVKPFIIGAAIAFILSIPLNFLEKKFKKTCKLDFNIFYFYTSYTCFNILSWT